VITRPTHNTAAGGRQVRTFRVRTQGAERDAVPLSGRAHLDVVGGRWRVLILARLKQGPSATAT